MPETRQRLSLRALLETKVPHSPSVSPEGTRVVFVVAESDFEESRVTAHLWMVGLTDPRPRQLTYSWEGEREPLWSPDGCWIAFLSARPDMTEPPPLEEEEEGPREQLWVIPADGGEARRLTKAREGVRSFRWTPDSEALIFLAPESRPQALQYARDDARKRKADACVEQEDKLRRQFWEVDLEDRKPELLFTGDFGIAEFDLSPDGKRIVFNTNYTGDANDYHQYDLFAMEIEQGEPRKLIERAGGQFAPRWSPDGRQIAFLAPLDPALSYSQECPWVVDEAGGEPRNRFAGLRYDAHSLVWRAGAGGLCAVAADGTADRIVRLLPDGLADVPLGESPTCVLDADVSSAGVIVAALESVAASPDLYVLQPDGSRQRLTEMGKALEEDYLLPRQEVVRWRSGEWEIEGVLTHPSGARDDAALPLVIQVHGGPKGRATNTLRSYHEHAVWAAEGYRVLRPNYRGSEGYGNAFSIANRRDLGGGDFADIMAGVDLLVERGLADPARIGIMGGSYGGYMTNWAITQTDRFAAAISMFGIFSLVSDYSNSEISRWEPDYMGAHYWDDPAIYRERSPATYLDRIKTPVLIVHGESDTNTFISNSREMYRALRDRGAAVEFVHYPREGHGLREPAHRLDEMRRCLAWFDRYLRRPAEGTAAGRIGDRIDHEGYELHVLRAEDVECAGWDRDEGRLLEVTIAVGSLEPVEESWGFALAEVALAHADEGACDLAGVVADAGGGKTLVRGGELTIVAHPDPDTGRVSFAVAAGFRIPERGGDFVLTVDGFPPVALGLGEKPPPGEEEQPEEEPPASRPQPEPAPGEPLPVPGPQKPRRPALRARRSGGRRGVS